MHPALERYTGLCETMQNRSVSPGIGFAVRGCLRLW
jgi:hypothetical protein